MSEALVRNNEADSQFELAAGGQTAVLTYQLKPGSIAFVHTGVPKSCKVRELPEHWRPQDWSLRVKKG